MLWDSNTENELLIFTNKNKTIITNYMFPSVDVNGIKVTTNYKIIALPNTVQTGFKTWKLLSWDINTEGELLILKQQLSLIIQIQAIFQK